HEPASTSLLVPLHQLPRSGVSFPLKDFACARHHLLARNLLLHHVQGGSLDFKDGIIHLLNLPRRRTKEIGPGAIVPIPIRLGGKYVEDNRLPSPDNILILTPVMRIARPSSRSENSILRSNKVLLRERPSNHLLDRSNTQRL